MVPIITTVVANQPPVAQPNTLIAWMDQATSVMLNATDADGDPLTYQIVSGPGVGTLTGTPPTLTYHPASGFTGTDTFTFTASDGSATSAPATVTMTVAAYDLKVNFQPTAAPTPPGYIPDFGQPIGAGQSFGWNTSSVIQTRDRNSALSPDQRYDTLIHMQKPENPNAVWEAPVPNGTYEITVVCGDASNFDSVFRLQIEDVLAVSGTPTSANHWVSSAPGLRVRVTDGRLTMSNGAGAVNNKVCFITALQVPTALFSARVNFQPANVAVPSGWVADTGAVYGVRNGLTYGWTIDNSANARVRNAASSPSVQFDTFNHMQKPGNADAIWEIAVPNGTYELVITSGDPLNIDSVFRLQAEGILAVSGTPTAANHWFTSAPGLRVTVTDGKLTVRNAAGASNNKINLIEIMQVPQAGG
ncbi:MAG TPA: Ig-like domain-containing protein [Planctomycetota bacterium]|nr:Ig-like domain-containing protein [Planctomycetota bacterium]